MSPGHRSNSKSVNPSLLRLSFQSLLSQSFIATLWIEANNAYWSAQYGVLADHYLAYDTSRRRW